MDGTSTVGVAHATLLGAFAECALATACEPLGTLRTRLVEAIGEAGMIDAAAVVGGFDGITRIADATGIPLEAPKAEQTARLRATLGIDRFLETKS